MRSREDRDRVIVDCAVYENGLRRPGVLSLDDAFEAAHGEGRFVWVGLHRPSAEEFRQVVDEFGLHELAVEDALISHQRAKVEQYDGVLLTVLKAAGFDERDDNIRISELHVFTGDNFVVTVRHGEDASLKDARRQLEDRPDLLALGPPAVLHAVLDRVVAGYVQVTDAVETRIEALEEVVFSESRESSAEKIYWLKLEVLEFYRGIVPLSAALDEILSGRAQKRPVSAELHPYFRDVDDRLHRIVGRVENARELLTAALEANLAKISVQQNNDMRAISSWAAIIAVPTMLAGIWGMNFRHMPEIDSRLGYPLALATMIGSALLVWWRLRKSGWL